MIGAVLVFHDVTEKRRAEEALRKSEQEFRTLAEVVPQIVWATRPDGWNIFFNQQWMDYTGLTLDESYGHGWNTPFHPDDKQRAWDAWQRATQHNETYLLECRLRRADGVYRWWLIHGTPMRGANGEIQKWFGTCTDIEEIKQAEEMDRRLAAIVESSSDAILSKTLDGIIRTWNAGAENLRIHGRRGRAASPFQSWCHQATPANYRKYLIALGEENGSRTSRQCACGKAVSTFPSP